MAEKRRYYVVEGSHYQDGKEFKKGEPVDSERDLMAMFPNKFSGAPITPDGGQEAQIVKDDSKGQKTSTGKDEKGTDVTDQFPQAVDNDMKVYAKGAWHFIYDPESETPDVQINEKGIKKDEVSDALDKILDA